MCLNEAAVRQCDLGAQASNVFLDTTPMPELDEYHDSGGNTPVSEHGYQEEAEVINQPSEAALIEHRPRKKNMNAQNTHESSASSDRWDAAKAANTIPTPREYGTIIPPAIFSTTKTTPRGAPMEEIPRFNNSVEESTYSRSRFQYMHETGHRPLPIPSSPMIPVPSFRNRAEGDEYRNAHFKMVVDRYNAGIRESPNTFSRPEYDFSAIDEHFSRTMEYEGPECSPPNSDSEDEVKHKG